MNHIDCKYYLATDVFKGICKRTKESILADEPHCEDFEKAPKCRYCKHFTESDEFMGLCMNQTPAFPDMQASTCKTFSWN